MTDEKTPPTAKGSKGFSTMKKIILALMLTPIFLLLIGFALPGDYSVQRTVFIAADAEAIHESLSLIHI